MTVQAFFTIVFGLAATVIAVQQWRAARRKLKIDLFQLRWPIYFQTVGFLRASGSGEISVEHRNAFIETIAKSEFLFDREMHDYLDRLHIDAHKLSRASPDA